MIMAKRHVLCDKRDVNKPIVGICRSICEAETMLPYPSLSLTVDNTCAGADGTLQERKKIFLIY